MALMTASAGGGQREPVPPTGRDIVTITGFALDRARVLAVAFAAAVGAALIDTNDDGRSVELVFLQHDGACGWADAGSCGAGTYGHGGGGAFSWAFGHLPGESEVVVQVAGRLERVAVSEDGWWLFIASLREDESPPQQAGRKFPDLRDGGEPRIAG